MDDQAKSNSRVTRRAFFGWAGKCAAIVAIGGLIRLRGREDDFIRPPRALPEAEFLSLCIRCDKCRKACPWNLITAVSLAESFISAGTPRLDEPCPRCMKCIPVCPTGALV